MAEPERSPNEAETPIGQGPVFSNIQSHCVSGLTDPVKSSDQNDGSPQSRGARRKLILIADSDNLLFATKSISGHILHIMI
jgi:hypothetical protein